MAKEFLRVVMILGLWGLASLGCAGGGYSSHVGLEGSKPVNDKEAVEYKKALIRCHKTGGTRIVKLKGDLRCF